MINSVKNQILIYGDAFIDYIANDETNLTYTKFLGGATVNVAAGVSRLGASCFFITVTGDDPASEFVRKRLREERVNLDYAVLVPNKRVSGVYIHLGETNERIFHKYIDETPDIQVEYEDLTKAAFREASIFHFGSGTLFQQTALETTQRAVELAVESDVLISFDANIRPLRWKNEELCRETIGSFLSKVDLLKLTEEELSFLTETKTIEDGIRQLERYGIPVVLITVGAKGAYVVIDGIQTHVGVEAVEAVDTTGAGDAFIAGILRQIHLKGKPASCNEWIDYIAFGNKLGALCATKQGALSALPYLEEIDE
ncbi:carbohydrate kinase [Sporosarcina siberiensis]|uniref:Carbohydrate kinase n=1 Tax=Sporosarcina siberiensis TaxID=1365606 RepID=A0ABW4SG14_9BACL